ncbi:MAG: PfkB family carbohydrate kinase, partial [Pseudomonadales bacterium]
EALIDMLSERCDDPVQSLERFVKFAGGAPANVAAGVAKLGGKSYFLGMLGQDMFGDFLHSSLCEMGVKDDYLLKTDAAKTALAFVSLDDSGERSFSFYRDPSADMLLRPEHLNDTWFEVPCLFHFCSNTLTAGPIAETTFEAIAKARRAGSLISFDINLRLNLWPQSSDFKTLIECAIAQCHLLKLSVEELELLALPLDQFLERSFNAGVALILLTDGAAPLRYFINPNLEAEREGTLAPPTIDVVDTTAAGDAFCAGFLWQLAKQNITAQQLPTLCRDRHTLARALRFACACGAHAASHRGAFTSLADSKALRSFDNYLEDPVEIDFFDPDFLQRHIDHTMAFYHPKCIDTDGGFYHYYKDDGSLYNTSHRHLVSSTRFIFNYAQAAIHCRDENLRESYLKALHHGLDFLETRHYNAATGGYAWQLLGAEVSDDTNHCYGFAFVLLAYSCAVKAGLTDYSAHIARTFDTMEQHFWCPQHLLYADERSADWQQLDSYRGQNANMHTVEALLAAYEATAQTHYLERALLVADNICNRQAALAEGGIWEHYTQDWQVDWEYNLNDPKNLFRPWGFQPGHFTEWAKLLLTIDRYCPTSWLLPRAKALFDRALDTAWDSTHGGIYYGFTPRGEICDDDKYFWVQAESFAAAALLYERATDAREREHYREIYHKIWDYAWQHLVDHEHGAWYRILRADNSRYDDEKSPAGKTDYHTMGACYEVLAMLARQAK